LVVACISVTAQALAYVQERLPVRLVGVIEPGARAAVQATRTGTIGVIGTAGTVASGAYERAITAIRPGARVHARACPLFVPLVEEGWFDHPATELIAREYLEPLRRAGVESLVLGCTHYPLLKPLLARVMGPDVTLVDSAEETAKVVARELEAGGLLAGEHGGIAGVVGERARQPVRDPEAQVGVQRAEHAHRDGMARDPMHQLRAPVLFGQPVAVGHERPAARDEDLRFAAVETDPQVLDEKIAAPAIVIAADHGDGDALGAQRLQLRHRPEVAPRDHGAVLEPEVEQVAVDEEGLA